MKKNKLHIIVLISIFCQTVFSSCQFEALETGLFSESIKLLVDSEPIETRSASSDGMELNQTIVMGEDGLLLQEFVCENLSLPFDDGEDTKSAVVTTDGLKSAAKFGIQCFVDNYEDIDCADDVKPVLIGDDQYIADGTVEYQSSKWGFTDGSGTAVDYKWLNKIHHTFWSFYPENDFPTSSFGQSASGTGRHKMTISDFAAPYNYASQKDLLAAYNNQYFDETSGVNTLTIRFKHILSQLCFEFDETSITGAGYTVTNIEISGAIAKGTCVIDAEATPMIAWTPNTSVTGTFTMVPSTDATLNNFFMIPQTLPTDAKIKITMTKGSETISREQPLNTTTWEPGYYYKYKLTYTPATYTFKLTTTGTDTQTFTDKNTSESKTKYVSITSTKKKGSAAAEQWDWDIQSYRIGSGSEVPVTSSASSFTAEDLIVTEDKTNKRLKLESKKWEGIDKGGHDYWTNKDGISGDSSGSGWSPADWSGTYTSSNPLDLSKFDYQSETTTSMNTANCYIVRHAGTYKIPLVYGNGVKNGSANSGAYSGFSSSTNGLATFVNHRNASITSPYIEKNTSCTASSAAIVWQDRQESGLSPVIPTSSVKLVGSTSDDVRYIQFTVSPENIRQTNAVIAVKNSSNQTMWSWHIWVTNDPAILSGAISVKNYSNNTYGFFPSSSLGWIEPKTYEDREDVTIKLVQKSSGETITVTVKQTKPDKIASSGVVYQWGRKDPFPTDNVSVTTSGSSASLQTAIMNPLTFYASGTGNNWFSTAYTNLWAGKYSGYFSSSISKASDLTSKTIYDPSPVGYKVPSIFAYTGFSTTGNDPGSAAATTASPTGYNVPSGTKFDKGWNFNTRVGSGTIFFDASGWSTNGTISSKGVEGNYHSALLYSSANNHIVYWAWGLDGANLYMKLTNTTGARLGASVRPVTE